MEHDPPPAPDPALGAMRDLAEQCAAWPLVRGFVEADVQAWPLMRERERRAAFERALRRTALVAPGALDGGRVREAARALGLASVAV